MGLLPSVWWLLGGGGFVALAVAAAVFFLGWPILLKLLTNRYVLGAIAIAVAGVAGWVWWESTKAGWIAQGRAEGELEREELRKQRRIDIADFGVDAAKRAADADEELRKTRRELELAQSQRPQGVGAHVTPKADAACVVPDGFVRYHDATVPRAAGRPAIPSAAVGAVDRPSGVPLSRVESVVAGNYDACQELLGRVPKLRTWCASECEAWDAKWGTKSDCARRCAPEAPSHPGSNETKAR